MPDHRREPGGEYVKNLVIKNVTTKTQKIQYKLPSTKFFSMEFPKVMTLSAGMSWTVPITFRPVTKVRTRRLSAQWMGIIPSH
jgi:hypothetical protein